MSAFYERPYLSSKQIKKKKDNRVERHRLVAAGYQVNLFVKDVTLTCFQGIK